ncbi:MAG: hypothetical protein ACJ71M_08440 [Nitrososphaeraceae archaeon]
MTNSVKYFNTNIHFVYGQISQISSNTTSNNNNANTNSLDVQNIPAKKFMLEI